MVYESMQSKMTDDQSKTMMSRLNFAPKHLDVYSPVEVTRGNHFFGEEEQVPKRISALEASLMKKEEEGVRIMS